MIREANTPFVFIATNVKHLNSVKPLWKQIELLSSDSEIGVVGGSNLNLTEHSSINCYQTMYFRILLYVSMKTIDVDLGTYQQHLVFFLLLFCFFTKMNLHSYLTYVKDTIQRE